MFCPLTLPGETGSQQKAAGLKPRLVQMRLRVAGHDLRLRRLLCGKAAKL